MGVSDAVVVPTDGARGDVSSISRGVFITESLVIFEPRDAVLHQLMKKKDNK